MASVEMAAALPVLVILVFTGIYAVRVVDARAQCLDAAREVARAAARGDVTAVARGRLMLGDAATVSVSTAGDSATARTSVRVHPGWSRLPTVTVTETATAAMEPAAGATTEPSARAARGPATPQPP